MENLNRANIHIRVRKLEVSGQRFYRSSDAGRMDKMLSGNILQYFKQPSTAANHIHDLTASIFVLVVSCEQLRHLLYVLIKDTLTWKLWSETDSFSTVRWREET